jgi:hypothetical protein
VHLAGLLEVTGQVGLRVSPAPGLDQREARHRGIRARREAERTSLAEPAASEALSVHRLVARTIRFADRNEPRRREQLRRSAIGVLSEQLDVEIPAGFSSRLELLIPHARQLVAGPAELAEFALLARVAAYDYQRGVFPSARQLQEQVLAGRREVLGERHPDTLTAMGNLAWTLSAQGELDAACFRHNGRQKSMASLTSVSSERDDLAHSAIKSDDGTNKPSTGSHPARAVQSG